MFDDYVDLQPCGVNPMKFLFYHVRSPKSTWQIFRFSGLAQFFMVSPGLLIVNFPVIKHGLVQNLPLNQFDDCSQRTKTACVGFHGQPRLLEGKSINIPLSHCSPTIIPLLSMNIPLISQYKSLSSHDVYQPIILQEYSIHIPLLQKILPHYITAVLTMNSATIISLVSHDYPLQPFRR